MGLMDKFNRQPSVRPDILGVAKGIVGNDPRAALQRMADSGMTCKQVVRDVLASNPELRSQLRNELM